MTESKTKTTSKTKAKTRAKTPKIIHAAGCLLWRRREAPDGEGSAGLEVGLVHRQRHDDWSLAKGKLEPGEPWPVAAVREVREETGYAVSLGPPLPTQHYVVEGAPKEVRYWAGEVVPRADSESDFVPNEEVDEIRWLDPEAAHSQLTYPHDADVLDAFVALTAALKGRSADVLIVLRHARAMKRAHWRGDDGERPLTEGGLAEAEALVPVLAAYGIDEIHSSNTRRCLDTVAPYAEALRLPIVSEPHVSERGHRHKPDAAAKRTAKLLGGGGRIVLCSHRPVLPAVLEAAIGPDDGREVIGTGLPPSAMVVVHHAQGRVLALDRHDPIA